MLAEYGRMCGVDADLKFNVCVVVYERVIRRLLNASTALLYGSPCQSAGLVNKS